jgi:hypothetical protein
MTSTSSSDLEIKNFDSMLDPRCDFLEACSDSFTILAEENDGCWVNSS